MIATAPRRKPTRTPSRPTRPVTEILRELVYLLHTTRVIAQRAKAPANS